MAAHEPWLDRWCEKPWRPLLTWIALTALAGEIILRNLSDGIAFIAVQLYEHWPMGSALLSGSMQVWPLAVGTLLLSWFQPFLLRLSLTRGFAWIGLVTLPATIGTLAFGVLPTWTWIILSCLPGLALIGWRSRPWMILPAAALYHAALWLTRDLRIDNYHVAIASGLYAAVLLYGTKLLPLKPALTAA